MAIGDECLNVEEEKQMAAKSELQEEEGLHGGGRIEDPQFVWRRSRVTRAWLQGIVERSVLGPQEELLWKASDGNFRAEDKTEAIVFASFFESGFGIPTGAFFWGLLYPNSNSILAIAFFIHLCAALSGLRRISIFGGCCMT